MKSSEFDGESIRTYPGVCASVGEAKNDTKTTKTHQKQPKIIKTFLKKLKNMSKNKNV